MTRALLPDRRPNPPEDGLACYDLAVAAIREMKVRAGDYPPINETERRWADEGPVPVSRLATVAA